MKKKPTHNLIGSQEIRSRYQVYGHFYSLKLDEGKEYGCRSLVEIVTANTLCTKLTDELPDAVVIMMNPGSSSPAEEINCRVYDQDTIGNLQPLLCKAKPDDTQDQIMRLMDKMAWNHVRVINLSDLRDGDSGKFCKLLKEIDSDLHSIFSASRSEELHSRLKRKPNAPLICAWGVSDDKGLIKLRQMAIPALSEHKLVGWRDETDAEGLKYYHAKPSLWSKREQWLNEIVAQLR